MTTLNEKDLYKARKNEVEIVEVPSINFLMADGQGDPNTSSAYKEAVETLYALSYALKFALKKAQGLEYKVGPLEGLWWAEDMAEFSTERKGDWKWTMMIAQPEAITPEWLEKVREEVRRKKNLPALDRMRLEVYAEGPSAQILHLGPYAAEGPTIQKLHAFIRKQGGGLDEKHHEIYLSDPRRTRPEKLKTILRQPYR